MRKGLEALLRLGSGEFGVGIYKVDLQKRGFNLVWYCDGLQRLAMDDDPNRTICLLHDERRALRLCEDIRRSRCWSGMHMVCKEGSARLVDYWALPITKEEQQHLLAVHIGGEMGPNLFS